MTEEYSKMQPRPPHFEDLAQANVWHRVRAMLSRGPVPRSHLLKDGAKGVTPGVAHRWLKDRGLLGQMYQDQAAEAITEELLNGWIDGGFMIANEGYVHLPGGPDERQPKRVKRYSRPKVGTGATTSAGRDAATSSESSFSIDNAAASTAPTGRGSAIRPSPVVSELEAPGGWVW